MGRLALAVLGVTAAWAAMLGSVELADLAIGAAIATALLIAVGQPGARPPAAPPTARRALHFLPWLGAVLAMIATGAWRVARVATAPRRRGAAAIVAVPIGERSRLGVAVSALTATVSPGDLVTDVDWEAGRFYVHVVALGEIDPEAVRRRYRRHYERYQRRVFP